jgi:hypothetical protein
MSNDSATVKTSDAPVSPPGQLAEQVAAMADEMAKLREQLLHVTRRESELRAILERESELDAQIDRLTKILRKGTMGERVTSAIDNAALRLEPFPYMVVDDLLPHGFYDSLLLGIPPVELFEHKPVGKQHLDVPFEMAPLYSRRVWRFMCSELVPRVISTALIARFRTSLDDWIVGNWPDIDPASVELHGSGGRIMLRRRGYRIRPHRDPKWSFITCILQLARPGDSETWGTQMLAVDDDQEAKNAAPYWIDEKKCRIVEDVAFRPNRLIVFLNSVGAHAAHIPADAEPATLERYIYQFRIGPTIETIARLRALLPEERQPLWAGKALIDY